VSTRPKEEKQAYDDPASRIYYDWTTQRASYIESNVRNRDISSAWQRFSADWGNEKKLRQLKGVGLAAPQVGYNKRIITIYIPKDAALLRDNVKQYPLHVMINPNYEITADTSKVDDFEACYSVTSKAGKVPRYKVIKLSYQNEHGQLSTSIESGFYARVLQHEIDHLNGILIIDRLTPDCLQGSVEDMMAIRRSELSADKKAHFDKLMKEKGLGPVDGP